MNSHFGPYGGRFVSETLMAALEELEQAWQKFSADALWRAELDELFTRYAGRPTPLTYANRLTETLGGAGIYLKREDLLHTGAHKLNNCLGQALLAQRMGKKRIIAETGAGQHGVATATVAAKLGFPCEIFMGAVDAERQKLNVHRMHLLGAKVHLVEQGTATLKDAMNEALRHWVTHIRDTHYIIGSVAGPHPYPTLVRDLQSIIGREAREQMIANTGRLPDVCVACVGGGSNAMGLFHAFVPDAGVALVGIEAQGTGSKPGEHAATLSLGRPGVLHGSKTYVLSNDAGQIQPAHSIAAGLDYPGVGPEHSWLKESGRAVYETAGDEEALAALNLLARNEGIICALETAHAVAYACRSAKSLGKDKNILICLSGRGDKDMPQLMARASGGAA